MLLCKLSELSKWLLFDEKIYEAFELFVSWSISQE